MTLKITASVQAATRRDDQADVYVAFCPSLQLYSQGTDEKRAKQAIESAIVLFLTTCIKHGVLDTALQQRGFASASAHDVRSPRQASAEFVSVEHYDHTFEVDVPLYLLNRSEEMTTC